MLLETRRWGPSGDAAAVLCVHGVTQHGGIFEPLGRRLAEGGRPVVAVDLRGHGASGHEPPWDVETHVDDLLETADALGLERVALVGHSFGAKVAAAAAARSPERVERLALLDPSLEIPGDLALRSAEIDRLDWSFESVDGAVNALMAGDSVVATPRETVAAYVKQDVRPGADGRLRFSHCPSATVAAWSEMARPAPPIAEVPTLIVRPVVPLIDGRAQDRRYRDALGSLLTIAAVPNGHNVLWESPSETIAAVEGFLTTAARA
jgi:lipase